MSSYGWIDASKALIAAGLVVGIVSLPAQDLPEELKTADGKPLVFDATEPTRGLPTTGVSLNGIAPADAKVVIRLGDQTLAVTHATADRRWMAHLPPQPPGEHTLSVQSGDFKTSLELMVYDPNRPTILNPAPLGKFGKEVTLNGLAEPGTSLRLLLNGRDVARTEVNEMGAWSFSTKTIVGTNVLTARGLGGHASVSGFRDKRTAIRPVLIKVQPMGGTLLVRGIASPFARVTVRNKGRLAGTVQANANGQWTLSYRGQMLGAQFEVMPR